MHMAAIMAGADDLPLLRWSDVTGPLSNRTDGFWEGFSGFFTNIPSNMEGVLLNLGNDFWSVGAWILRTAGTANVDRVFGPFANRFAGAVYTSLTASWLVPGMIAVCVIALALWQVVSRGDTRMAAKRIGALALGTAMFALMGSQAAAHPNDAAVLTPWWVEQKASSILGQTGGDIASKISQAWDDTGAYLADSNATDRLSCRRYTAQLRKDAGAVDPTLDSMSRMWEETGLRMWARAQYGSGDNGMQVFCRVLEDRAGIDPEVQSRIVNDASGGVAHTSGRAAAFNPNLLIREGEKPNSAKDDTISVADSKTLDRAETMWDVCGMDDNGKPVVRPGWGFVNSLPGAHRGVEGWQNDMTASCNAVLTGSSGRAGDDADYHVVASNGNTQIGRPDVSGGWDDGDSKGVGADGKPLPEHNALRHLNEKFDIDGRSSWQTVAGSGDLNSGDATQRSAAVQTMEAQRGNGALADTGGAFMFLLAGLVNLVIWGLGFGLLRLVCAVLIYLVAGVGLFPSLLIYACAPERGSKAIGRAGRGMVGMSAATTVIGVVAAIVNVVDNALMMALGLLGTDGNSSGTIAMTGIATLVLPPISLMVLDWICTHVWGFGSPFSIRGVVKMVGGQPAARGLSSLGNAAVGGIGALTAGGGLSGMAKGFVRGAMQHNDTNSLRDAAWAMRAGRNVGMGEKRRRERSAADRSASRHMANEAEEQALRDMDDAAFSQDPNAMMDAEDAYHRAQAYRIAAPGDKPGSVEGKGSKDRHVTDPDGRWSVEGVRPLPVYLRDKKSGAVRVVRHAASRNLGKAGLAATAMLLPTLPGLAFPMLAAGGIASAASSAMRKDGRLNKAYHGMQATHRYMGQHAPGDASRAVAERMGRNNVGMDAAFNRVGAGMERAADLHRQDVERQWNAARRTWADSQGGGPTADAVRTVSQAMRTADLRAAQRVSGMDEAGQTMMDDMAAKEIDPTEAMFSASDQVTGALPGQARTVRLDRGARPNAPSSAMFDPTVGFARNAAERQAAEQIAARSRETPAAHSPTADRKDRT